MRTKKKDNTLIDIKSNKTNKLATTENKEMTAMTVVAESEAESQTEKGEQSYKCEKNVAYSVSMIAKILGVRTGKVNQWIATGNLICLNIGHRIILHEDLMDFLRKYRGYDISDINKIKKLPFYDNDCNTGA